MASKEVRGGHHLLRSLGKVEIPGISLHFGVIPHCILGAPLCSAEGLAEVSFPTVHGAEILQSEPRFRGVRTCLGGSAPHSEGRFRVRAWSAHAPLKPQGGMCHRTRAGRFRDKWAPEGFLELEQSRASPFDIIGGVENIVRCASWCRAVYAIIVFEEPVPQDMGSGLQQKVPECDRCCI